MQRIATHPSDSTRPPLTREQGWAALLLAWAAAFSDAIGFLVLKQLGASFMSGNSMAMGIVRASMQQTSFRHLLLLGGDWGSYVVGAICGSALELHLALFALVFPLYVLVVLIVLDVFRPLQVD